MISKLIRGVSLISSRMRNTVTLMILKSKYAGFSFTGNTFIGKKCDIRCTVGSQIIIKNSHISQGCQIVADHGGIIEINNAFIGPNSVIVCHKGIRINNHCQIAEMVTIRDQNHKYGAPGKTIEEQGFTTKPIEIGSNVWIAAKATILAGVTVGENAVIAAHSVVNKLCEANAVYGGAPAKKLKGF